MKQFTCTHLLRIALCLVCVGLFPITKLSAQFTITENFKGKNVDGNIKLGGRGTDATQHAYLTAAKGIDPNNEGWLRLTEAQGNRAGYAYLDIPFPSTLGVYIEFEYKAWRDRADGYKGADGFSVFLFDAATPQFRIGGYGGSLGYANHSSESQQGLAGAYLGIGIDEYGNFARAEDGRHGGTSNLQPNSITLRGPESTQWKYLTHEQLQTSPTDDGPNSVDYNKETTIRPNDATFYRKVKVIIDPIGTDASPKYKISVLWTTTVGGADRELLTYETTDKIPANLKLGFGASTGGGFNCHEIRNLLITTPGGMRVQKSVDKVNALPGDDLTYTVDVYNQTDAVLKGMVLGDTIKLANGATVLPDDFEITDITFNNNGNAGNTATGVTITNPFTATMDMAANSKATFTIKGTIKRIPIGGILKNSVGIDPAPTGISDTDLTNNYASVTTNILNPNVDLTIEKGVDNNGIARQGGNIFTIVVSNMSSVQKPDGQTVEVKDAIPVGLSVASVAPNGWSVSNTGNSYTFTRSDELKAGYSYPPILINVMASGTGPWTNTATVGYAHDTDVSNNSSSATLRWPNYWIGGTTGKLHDWSVVENWTGNYVPVDYENVEFATEANNGGTNGRGTGPAKQDLHLDRDRIIGDLVNLSDKNLVVTTGNGLKVNGKVPDSNIGGIVVKADPEDKVPEGTLIFVNPENNRNVKASVEFYNKAYECDNCGFYRKQWQYFGIPVQEVAKFPYRTPSAGETVNQWVEKYNGDKWRPAPFDPADKLQAFKGYQITNTTHSGDTPPQVVYPFVGTIFVNDAVVALTKTENVNYSGSNLIGNSYTAAIPIRESEGALTIPAGFEKVVYLFNTGTRDQWRKLNGTSVSGVAGGQYLAVPVANAGNGNLPAQIPSMHAFMVLSDKGAPQPAGEVKIAYKKLVKNATVDRGDGTQIVTRAAGSATVVSSVPSLVMDVIGAQSADRVWIFTKEGATHGFDNGWDGRKMEEGGIAQLFVAGSDNSKFQVATVPDMDNVSLGFVAEADGKYTLEFALSDHWAAAEVYLLDRVTGAQTRVVNGGSYSFEAKKGDGESRFSLSGKGSAADDEGAQIAVNATADGKIAIANNSGSTCSVFVSDLKGKLVQRLEVKAGNSASVENIAAGIYIVRLQNGAVSDARRVIVK